MHQNHKKNSNNNKKKRNNGNTANTDDDSKECHTESAKTKHCVCKHVKQTETEQEDEKKGEERERDDDEESKQRALFNRREFVAKIKEIERRIIEHLHKRGYFEDNPDF